MKAEKKKVNPSTKNAAVYPMLPMRRAPAAGPMTKVILNVVCESEFATKSCSLETIFGTVEEYAGKKNRETEDTRNMII